MTKQLAVAFVCLGNICRSPMAEAVFKQKVKDFNLEDRFSEIDSFGTAGFHVGEEPDPRSSSTCRNNGVPVSHRGQQIKAHHFDMFDYIICMDDSNKRNLERMKPEGSKATIHLFGEWNTNGVFKKIVDDPYYGGDDGFEYNFNQIAYFSEEFLKKEL
ncbi:HBL126Cp [Eremothecium sinecaudum]|uniref:HBL126Cp n=1 Tax=Eremothecium sinecaudum TaxID=45286 RepID=A0A109UWC2_9SACH|nr:HBL126Cp [Eremothecium sinecaudum]AMD18776.1 HBL126Cp [Eremothecium sinecaudum]